MILPMRLWTIEDMLLFRDSSTKLLLLLLSPPHNDDDDTRPHLSSEKEENRVDNSPSHCMSNQHTQTNNADVALMA